MGSPVIHFDVMGRDGEKLRSFHSKLPNRVLFRPGLFVLLA